MPSFKSELYHIRARNYPFFGRKNNGLVTHFKLFFYYITSIFFCQEPFWNYFSFVNLTDSTNFSIRSKWPIASEKHWHKKTVLTSFDVSTVTTSILFLFSQPPSFWSAASQKFNCTSDSPFAYLISVSLIRFIIAIIELTCLYPPNFLNFLFAFTFSWDSVLYESVITFFEALLLRFWFVSFLIHRKYCRVLAFFGLFYIQTVRFGNLRFSPGRRFGFIDFITSHNVYCLWLITSFICHLALL